ncbi:MAG: CHRD domain-containing protein [Vitreoscilla sp.]|nr:CHRD domain-containing protein [Vitreoscilla sp.]
MMTAPQVADLTAGKWHASLHTVAHPGGEVRRQVIVRP